MSFYCSWSHSHPHAWGLMVLPVGNSFSKCGIQCGALYQPHSQHKT
jgi:hypothetical protein